MFQWLKTLPLRFSAASQGFKTIRIEEIFGGILNGFMTIAGFRGFDQYLRAGSKNIWATWKACDICAKSFVDTPIYLVKPGGDGTPIQSKEISKLLARPNPFWSLKEMMYLYVFHMKLTGNAYWFKDQSNLNGQRPGALYPLNPRRMKIVVTPRVGITGYLYLVNGVTIPMTPDEVIHFRNPHPDNDYWGLGDIEAGEDLFNEFINRETWAKMFWKNGASPSGVLICEDNVTDETSWKKAKLAWQQEYGGTKNGGKTAWLTGKWKYQQLGLTAVEMQHLEHSKFNIENIFHMHGVPLSVAGFKESANYATARIDEMIFRRYTIKPLFGMFIDKLQAELIDGYGQNVQLFAQVTGLTDVAAIATDYGPLFDRGVFSINELRQMCNMPKKSDDPMFDGHYILTTYGPLELAGISAPPPAGTEPPPKNPAPGQAAAIIRRGLESSSIERVNGTGHEAKR